MKACHHSLNLGMSVFRRAWFVFKKDALIEFRARYALNTVLAFTLSSLLLLLLLLNAQSLPPTPKSGLIWIIILFAALSVLGRSFITETERGTYDLLRLYGKAHSIYLGKLIFNSSFTLLINIFAFTLFIFFLDLVIVNLGGLLLVVFFGALGFSSVSTLIAALVAQADRKGIIFSVLGIPILVPFLLILGRVTRLAFLENNVVAYYDDILSLIGFVGVTITVGVLLFEYVWEE
jgi:heme exporter protein B